ncbi:hypothetical protein GCM10010530_75230 [Kribbella aluminosa]
MVAQTFDVGEEWMAIRRSREENDLVAPEGGQAAVFEARAPEPVAGEGAKAAHEGVAGQVTEGLGVDGLGAFDVALEIVDVADRQAHAVAVSDGVGDQAW